MRKILRSYWLNVLIIVLFGWALTSFFTANEQFAEVIKKPEPPWEVEIFALPILLLMVLGAIFVILDIRVKRREGKRISSALFLPSEFVEDDERERMVTAKACRAAYMSMWVAGPFLGVSLVFYPFFKVAVPYFPVIAFMLLLLIQITAYHVSLRKNM